MMRANLTAGVKGLFCLSVALSLLLPSPGKTEAGFIEGSGFYGETSRAFAFVADFDSVDKDEGFLFKVGTQWKVQIGIAQHAGFLPPTGTPDFLSVEVNVQHVVNPDPGDIFCYCCWALDWWPEPVNKIETVSF